MNIKWMQCTFCALKNTFLALLKKLYFWSICLCDILTHLISFLAFLPEQRGTWSNFSIQIKTIGIVTRVDFKVYTLVKSYWIIKMDLISLSSKILQLADYLLSKEFENSKLIRFNKLWNLELFNWQIPYMYILNRS